MCDHFVLRSWTKKNGHRMGCIRCGIAIMDTPSGIQFIRNIKS